MKKETTWSVDLWQFVGFVAVSLLGTLLHYLYDWTDSVVAALISGVNESTWEHMKLLFFPMVLVAVVQSFFLGKEYENFLCIKTIGTLLGILLIPTIFYTLRGAFGTTPDWINIAIFFVAAAIAFWMETRLFKNGAVTCCSKVWPIAVLCLLTVAFWVFTFIPPEIPLFRDPVEGSYGLVR